MIVADLILLMGNILLYVSYRHGDSYGKKDAFWNL